VKSNTFTQIDKEKLSRALGACAAVQRTYGKQVSDLEAVVKVFIKVLDGYEPKEIMQAIKKWLTISPEFPTPSDILKILDPQPIYDKTVYISIKNKLKNGEFLMQREEDYIRKYESNVINSI
jgi:hypothetical protein